MEQSRAGSMGLSVYEKGHFRVCYHSRLTQPVVFLSLCLWKDLTRPLCTGRVATVRPLNPQPSQHRTTDKSQYFNFNFTHFPHKTYFHINTYRYIYTISLKYFWIKEFWYFTYGVLVLGTRFRRYLKRPEEGFKFPADGAVNSCKLQVWQPKRVTCKSSTHLQLLGHVCNPQKRSFSQGFTTISVIQF